MLHAVTGQTCILTTMTFSFYVLHRSLAYWVTLGLFALVNVWTGLRFREALAACCEQRISAGFPFLFLVAGGDPVQSTFFWTGLLLDVVIARTLAVILAWLLLRLAAARQAGVEPSGTGR